MTPGHYALYRLGAEVLVGLVILVGGGWLLTQPHSVNMETGFFAVVSGITGYWFGKRDPERVTVPIVIPESEPAA